MVFFEQIGKKLTDAGQLVAQQTKNLSEVARLNGAIAEKEKHISDLYLAIGQSYYEQHRKDPFAEEIEKIEQINALFAQIDQQKEAVKQIRGIGKCPHCGADVALDAVFCNACGTNVPKVAPVVSAAREEARICPNCHGTVGKENQFCIHCGTKMDE